VNLTPGAKREKNIYQKKNSIVKESESSILKNNDFRHLCIGVIFESKVRKASILKYSFVYVGQQLRLKGCGEITIKNNIFRHQAYSAIEMRKCSQIQVLDNAFDNATSYSIRITGGGENTIKNNTISDVYAEFHGGGVLLLNTQKNIIENNKFKNCEVGIRFIGLDSKGNRVENNKFENTKRKVLFAPKDSDAPMKKMEADKVMKENTVWFSNLKQHSKKKSLNHESDEWNNAQ
jgi:parallel beta-helix repeat protein